ncbi:hypothetical protein CB1_000445022 [Camelus ferus]|nr:hypothetical protein CB1_001315021 [Camelus ferus]EPY84751.1 hypothetical protein CB1_000445022 [Camelus ferus]
MASLQTPLLAALILLAMILQATEAGPYAANVEDSICCRDYIRHPLPPRVVKYYYWTSDSCRRPGVVFFASFSLAWSLCLHPSLAGHLRPAFLGQPLRLLLRLRRARCLPHCTLRVFGLRDS